MKRGPSRRQRLINSTILIAAAVVLVVVLWIEHRYYVTAPQIYHWWVELLFVATAVLLFITLWLSLKGRRESREKDLLFEIGRRISATLDREELLNLILDGLQEVVGFDAAAIFLVDIESGEMEYNLTRGYDQRYLDRLQLKVGQGLVGFAVENNEPVIVDDVRENPRYINARSRTRSEMCVPLSWAGEIVAVINLEADARRAYRRRDLRLLEAFGAQAAVAIENASCYFDAQERRNLEQELQIAGEIQRALLPASPPEVEGLEVATFFRPSRSIGGDLYDLVPLGEGRLGVAIGDISGKGTPAAILMASLYASFRSLTRKGLFLPEIMRQLNNLLCENFGLGRFATFFYGVIDTPGRTIYYSNAGHFAPLLIKAGEEPETLSDGGIVLGYLRDSEYDESRRQLDAGDIVLLYTDGVIEAEGPGGEMFGEERLVDTAATLIGRSAKDVLDGVRNAVMNHCRQCEQADDITLVVVKVL